MNMTSKYTKHELRRDYEEAAYDRKNLSIKYGVPAKGKDIQEKIDDIMSHVHTPLIDGLIKLQSMLPMKKKEYVDYISHNIILEVAYTDKGTVTKASVAYALAMARAEATAPEAYEDDYAELKIAYELAKKSEDSTKLIKEMDKELDEKARERYATLTDDEIFDLLVNKKWYYTIGTGINNLYAAISHRLADRIIELSKRYENTLPDLMKQTAEYEAKVKSHLERMGFKW